MTSPAFVNSLRSRPGVVKVGTTDGTAIEFRVEAPEVWDVVRIAAAPSESVRAVKLNALQALCPDSLFPDEYVVKLYGKEIFDESLTLDAVGVKPGSVLLMTHRRRRPVRS
jgi:hypothetical protein